MSHLQKAADALQRLESYDAYNGQLRVHRNHLYLFGEVYATNLKTHLAINLNDAPHTAHQLNYLEGIQFERVGDDKCLYLNGQPVLYPDRWLIVNKAYGDWDYE